MPPFTLLDCRADAAISSFAMALKNPAAAPPVKTPQRHRNDLEDRALKTFFNDIADCLKRLRDAFCDPAWDVVPYLTLSMGSRRRNSTALWKPPKRTSNQIPVSSTVILLFEVGLVPGRTPPACSVSPHQFEANRVSLLGACEVHPQQRVGSVVKFRQCCSLVFGGWAEVGEACCGLRVKPCSAT